VDAAGRVSTAKIGNKRLVEVFSNNAPKVFSTLYYWWLDLKGADRGAGYGSRVRIFLLRLKHPIRHVAARLTFAAGADIRN